MAIEQDVERVEVAVYLPQALGFAAELPSPALASRLDRHQSIRRGPIGPLGVSVDDAKDALAAPD